MTSSRNRTKMSCEKCGALFRTSRPGLTLCPTHTKAALNQGLAELEYGREEARMLTEERHREFLRSAPPPTEAEWFLARAAEAGVPGAARRAVEQARYWK